MGFLSDECLRELQIRVCIKHKIAFRDEDDVTYCVFCIVFYITDRIRSEWDYCRMICVCAFSTLHIALIKLFTFLARRMVPFVFVTLVEKSFWLKQKLSVALDKTYPLGMLITIVTVLQTKPQEILTNTVLIVTKLVWSLLLYSHLSL